jgi:methyl-accepting chemotaxis protein
VRLNGIAAKIWFSIGIFAVGYFISIGTGQLQGYSTERRLRTTAETLFPVAQRTQEASESFLRMARHFNDAVMIEDETALERASQEASNSVRLLRLSASLPGIAEERQQAITKMASDMEQVAANGRSTYGGMMRAKGNMTPELQQQSRSLATLMESVKKGLQSLAANTAQDLQNELQELERTSGWQRRMNVTVLVLTLLISIFFINRTIQHSVIGPVVRVIRGVELAVGEASMASEQMANSGARVSEKAAEQATYLRQTATSLHKIAAQSKSNSERASEADRVMGNVREEVDLAKETMQKLTLAIQEISSSSRQVAGILKTIEEIAFHTNILALNAAVEAARAGEAGSGFSVVADEVRSLAHRSSESAANIAMLIEGTLQKVDIGSAMVTRSSVAFRNIAEAILAGSSVVTEIASANEEQRRGVEQISGTVSRMDQVTHTNATMAEDAAAAATTMSEQVRATRSFIDELARVVGN